jgi:hypothetical protein
VKFSKGIHFQFVTTLFIIFILHGYSDGGSSDSTNIPAAELQLSAPPEINWINSPVRLNQINTSNFIFDTLTVYDFHQWFFKERDLIIRALANPSIVTPVTECD